MWKIKRMYIASEMNVQAGPYTVYGILTKGILTGSYFKKPENTVKNVCNNHDKVMHSRH